MPFTQNQFFDVFARYNDTVWPAQAALYGIALFALVLAARGSRNSRYVCGLLALLWIWMALAYHVGFFRQINPAALLFAALFLLQAALFVWYGVIRDRIAISAGNGPWRVTGMAFIVYALLLYPVIATLSGQRYPAMPTFGLPCPTTIFTLGLLMWTRSAPAILWIVPVLWALIATQVAIRFGVYEDFGLTLAAGAAAYFVIAYRLRGRRIHGAGAA